MKHGYARRWHFCFSLVQRTVHAGFPYPVSCHSLCCKLPKKENGDSVLILGKKRVLLWNSFFSPYKVGRIMRIDEVNTV